MAPLPIAALRLPAGLLETLASLGAERVGDLIDLPRDQLRVRFGPLLALRLDQALGAAREVFSPVQPPAELAVDQPFEFPVAQQEAVHHSVAALVTRLAWLLSARCAGALRLACRFDCEAAPPAVLEVGFFQPTANARRLLEIVELAMERLRLPAPATGISIQVLKHATLVQRQGALFEEDRSLGNSLPLAALVDRLAGRLGSEAVVRCQLTSDAQPELAYREQSLVDAPRRRRAPAKAAAASAVGPLDRPLCLLQRPAPLEAVSVVPDGPPISFRRHGRLYHVARQWGPERIETGWWRGQSTGRDYYRVETGEGRRFWLFRRRRDGRWFLHGVFE